jgi:hypothetical protein
MVSELRFLLAQGADLESNLHVQTRNHPSVKREKSFMMLIVVDVGSWLREEIEGAEYKVEQPGVGLYTNGARVTTDAAVDARLEVTSSWSLIL